MFDPKALNHIQRHIWFKPAHAMQLVLKYHRQGRLNESNARFLAQFCVYRCGIAELDYEELTLDEIAAKYARAIHRVKPCRRAQLGVGR